MISLLLYIKIIGAITKMVKPGSIIGGFIIAISIAIQVITLVEIAHYYWLLFIWVAGLIAGITYVLGGLVFEQDKMEAYTISRLITSKHQNPNVPEVLTQYNYPELEESNFSQKSLF